MLSVLKTAFCDEEIFLLILDLLERNDEFNSLHADDDVPWLNKEYRRVQMSADESMWKGGRREDCAPSIEFMACPQVSEYDEEAICVEESMTFALPHC